MIKLAHAFEQITDYFSPKVIGEVNDVYVKLAKIKGDDIPWHHHQDEDELFYVFSGSLKFEVKGEAPFTLEAGDIYIVRKGVQHRVSSEAECLIMLIEPKSTQHTGEVKTAITKSLADQLS